MNDELVEALIDAVADVLRAASWYPDDEYGTPEMTAPSSLVIAMDLAYEALIQARAEEAYGVVRD